MLSNDAASATSIKYRVEKREFEFSFPSVSFLHQVVESLRAADFNHECNLKTKKFRYWQL